MNQWKEYKLGNAPIKFIDGDRGKNYPSQGEFFSKGHCLFLSTKNVRQGGFDFTECSFITLEKDLLLRKGKLQRNDIILTTRGTIGNLAFFDDKVPFNNVRINSGMLIIRPNEEEVTAHYCFYIFRSLQNTFITFTSGSAQPQLPIRDLNEIDILLPPLPEQRAIASILSSLDDKIDLLHRQNATLEALAETLFRQWFVEEAEESWEKGKLGNVFDIGIGRTPPRKEQQWFTNNAYDYKWASIKDMGNCGMYIDSTSEYLTEDAVIKFNVPIIPKNTVLFSFKMTIGRIAISTQSMLSNEAIAHFKIKNNSILSSEYLYLFLKSFKYEALGSTSSIVDAINSQMIKEIEISIPNKDKINKFHVATESYFDKILNNTQQIRTLTQLRDTLLPKLMSGEVRVRE